MKIGIITASLPMDTKTGLRKARELGAHGVQLWIVDNDLDPRNLTQSGRKELVDYMASLDLERSALCGDIGGFTDLSKVDERIARTKQMFDLCVDLKTPILTTHIGVVPGDPLSREYNGLLEAVREIAEYAANRDCCFATETGPEPAETLAAFLDRANSSGAKANYDPANLVMSGFNHLEGLYALGTYVVHTHAKDGIAHSIAEKKEVMEVPLGKGDVDFPRYLHILREELGYTGYLTIERECGDDPIADIAEAIAFLKRQPGVER